MEDPLSALVRRHREGEPVGITSICSAHPVVLEAVMREAAADAGPVLIEATSNQVDQHGGYTGMRPSEFRRLVLDIARGHGIATERVMLGGDHLGPNPWRGRPAAEAMALAEELVAAYVDAGFTKLHLDCSMACADDPPALDDSVVSQRAARLMRIAEDACIEGQVLSYVIGTEVPDPGGAAEAIERVEPTSAAAARATLRAHRQALASVGLERRWGCVRGLVVQPGVEFDEWSVVDYAPERTGELQHVLDAEPGMVFEAHSTDYQTPDRLAALVRDHWAILKVGPALTFALREALFALEAIETELCPRKERSRLRAALEQGMLDNPGHWVGHHHGGEHAQRVARAYSYSDRVRYYWAAPAIGRAVELLLTNLAAVQIPLTMLSQFLPLEYARVRSGELAPEPRELILDHIGAVLRDHRRACTAAVSPAASEWQARPSPRRRDERRARTVRG